MRGCQRLQQRGRGHDADRAVAAQPQQIIITGNNDVGTSSDSAGDHGIVIRVVADRRRERRCNDDASEGRVLGKHSGGSCVVSLKG